MAQTFDPYGNPYSYTGPTESVTRYGYSGEQTDSNGLVFLRARYYAPSMGRFVQMDPSRQEDNPYRYGLSNPVLHTDPSGNQAGPGEGTIVVCYGIAFVIPFDALIGGEAFCTGLAAILLIAGTVGTVGSNPEVQEETAEAVQEFIDLCNYLNLRMIYGGQPDRKPDRYIPPYVPPQPRNDDIKPVYRLGNRTGLNLTPRPNKDVPSGLSMTTTIPTEPAVMFPGGKEGLNLAGFDAIPAPNAYDPGHFLLRPRPPLVSLEAWAAARPNTDNDDPSTWHPLTLLLYGMSVRYNPLGARR